MTKFDCRFDATSNTLFISANFAKKASDTRSAEYRHLYELLRNNPNMKIEKRTRIAGNRLTYKDMEAKLRQIDENGKLVEAFKLVKELSEDKTSPYAFVYNWYKAQMEAAKVEKKNEKKASTAMSKEDMKKKLKELEGSISFKSSTSADAEEDLEMEEAYEEKEE